MPLEEIKSNDWDLSINKYRKEKEVEQNHRKSSEILREMKKEVKELMKGIEELEHLR